MLNYAYSILYVLIASYSFIFMQNTEAVLPPSLSLVSSVFLTTVYFHLINIHKIKHVYKQLLHDKLNFLLVNLTVMVMWGCSFYSVYFVGPFSYLFIFFSTAAVFGFFFKLNESELLRWPRLISLVTIILIIVGYILYVENHSRENYIFGDILALLSGSMSYAYSKSSFVFSKKTHLTATQILSVRFFALLIFGVLLCLFAPQTAIRFDLDIIWRVILLAALAFILPLYFFQKAILKIGPEGQTIFNALTPAVTYLLVFILQKEFHFFQFLTSIFLAFMLVFPSIFTFIHKYRAK